MSEQTKTNSAKEDSKVRVEIFTSFGGCCCSGASFMDRVWNVLLEFRDRVDFTTESLDSPEADQYRVIGSFVVVDGQTVLGRNLSEGALRAAINQALAKREQRSPKHIR